MLRSTGLMGNMADFLNDPVQMFRTGYEQHGPVFGIRLAHMKGCVVVGADRQQRFYDEIDRRLSVAKLYKFVIPMFGSVALAQPDVERRIAQVRLLHRAFAENRMKAHLAVMTQEADLAMGELGERGGADLWELCERFAIRVSASALLGPEVRQDIDRLVPMLDDLARGMEFVLPPWLPLPRFIRRDSARRRLRTWIQPMLDERRAHPRDPRDFLQVLVDGDREDRNGGADLVGITLLTLFTGYITTAASMAWLISDVLDQPKLHERLQYEVRRDPSTAARSSLVANTILESIRKNPVMSHYARIVEEPIVVDDYTIPKGWQLIVVPSLAHQEATHFPNPEAFDPDRFHTAGGLDRPPVFLGFSAGQYRCPGRVFGLAELACLLVEMLRRFEVRYHRTGRSPSMDRGVIRPPDRALLVEPVPRT
ncbi:cytochrome P450 [Saccharopolyspora cebuensis]|uniref:cytochrome P450 n=1 Tax=Saccharopolyspora cebuensis TaxID=418759 RepID=UPI0031F1B048